MPFQAPSYPTLLDQTITESSKLPDFVLYLFNFGVILGFSVIFISLAIAGVLFFFSPFKPDLRERAKDRITGSISGLLILIFTYLIVTTINPKLSMFTMGDPLQEQTLEISQNSQIENPGVYLFKNSSCDISDPKQYLLISSSTNDLGEFNRNVSSSKIVHSNSNNIAYVSILYENPNFFGKCQYIDPNSSCVNSSPAFATSASVHIYDFDPKGDGIYFFRKPCFNSNSRATTREIIENCKKTGYYYISNSQIKDIFFSKLENLKFTNVPDKEKICIKYDSSGNCASKDFPSLGGENISSFIIHGDYVIILVYYKHKSGIASDIYTSCQEFPKPGDLNKKGPFQIKWQNIRNYSAAIGEGGIPNYIAIIPVKK
jgi:hypothetical protein